MDDEKDTKNSSEIAKFVESHTVRTNPFAENRVGERAYRRAERIAAALTLLTNHVPEHEPLRTAVRSKSAGLLSYILDLRDEMRSANSEKVRILKSSIRELISLTRLLAVSGFISLQNATTVSEALDELSGFLLASQRSHLSETTSFSREYFLDMRSKRQVFPEWNNDHKMSKMAPKDIQDIKDRKNNTALEGDVAAVTAKGQANFSTYSMRAYAIAEVLRTGGALGIRDIASSLPEYSEKMIQRELAQMVESGRIKKTGSKRWSMYSLIHESLVN